MKADATLGRRFQLVRQVASGGMGTVYQGTDRKTGTPVAIKLMNSGNVADPRRFHREVKSLKSLSHPNIVSYIDDGKSKDGRLYIVQEWLEGATLAEVLRSRQLTAQESIVLMRQLSGALAHVHAKGIVHRDIKPANIFLLDSRPERLKLLDFGIARSVGGNDIRVTDTGVAVGSIGYMAPEQVRGSRDLTVSVDVFAMGCLLYELLAGEPAFAGSNMVSVCAKIVLLMPPPPHLHRPELPAQVSELLTRMLAKSPTARPRDAGEVAAVLDALAPMPDTRPPPREDRSEHYEDASTATMASPLLGVPSVADRSLPQSLELPQDGAAGPAASVIFLELPDGRTDAAAISAAIADHGATISALDDSAAIVIFPASRDSRDSARSAMRAALLLRRAYPDAGISLATGSLNELGATVPTAALDAAAAALAGDAVRRMTESIGGTRRSAIALTADAAALLQPDYPLKRLDGQWYVFIH